MAVFSLSCRSGTAAFVFALLLFGAAPSHADDQVVKSFGIGTGANSVGITAAEDSEDKEEDAPQAVYAGDDGKLFVLDQVNGRILKFDPTNPNAPPQTLKLPPDIQPTDLVVKGDDIYVWDGSAHALKAVGAADAPVRGLTETRSGEPLDQATQDAFAQMGSQTMPAADATTRGLPTKMADFSRQIVSTRGHGDVSVDITPIDKGAGADLDVKLKGQAATLAKLHVRVHDKLGTVAYLEMDRDGRSFVLLENIPNSVDQQASAFVARYSPKGAIEGIYELPLASTTTLSRRFVTVSPDGDVYFLRTQKASADIIGLGFRATPNAKVLELAGTRNKPDYAAIAIAQTKGMSMAVGPLTRDKILQIANGFESVQWKLSDSNYGADPDQQCNGFPNRIRRPMYLIGKKDEYVRSVPYCWGCQGSLSQFVARIEKGALAGNVCTKNNVRFDVVGVDCSSFVSATWGLSSHFATSAIPSITKELSSAWDLLPGDALDKPGSHVVLFLGFTPDRKAMVMEASPGACNGKVCRNVYPLSSLLARGFVPLRYRALIEEKTAEAK